METKFEDFLDSPMIRLDEQDYVGLHCTISKDNIRPIEASNPFERWDCWYRVVEEYTLRDLTQPADKLPAISGIANWLLGGHPDTYLARLLKEDLHASLTWVINPTADLKPRATVYRGPSWSWASTDYAVTFAARISRNNALKPQWVSTEFEERRPPMSSQRGMIVQDIHIETSGLNPFGEVKSASMKVRARIKTGIVTIGRLGLHHPFIFSTAR